MACYLVSYDSRQSEKPLNYKKFIDRINQYPNTVEVAEFCWIFNVSWSCAEIYADLEDYMNPNDQIFVAILEGTATWTKFIAKDYLIKEMLRN